MFESLSERLNSVFKKLKGHGKLNEQNIKEGLREVRMALLEADVHYKVARDFIESVRQRAIGQEVMESLTPAQQVIKIVHEELISLMGGVNPGLDLKGQPSAIMLVGLQGSGKTTTAAKLARFIKENKNRRPYLVPADIYRPAAIDQLEKLGTYIEVPVYIPDPQMNPVDICTNAILKARTDGYDIVILDTAGRLHIDEILMEELRKIKDRIYPSEILLVADAMTGQDAINVAQTFNEWLNIDGVILTKMEGDARGGAALSIKAVTGRPIKFIGVGEKIDAIELFHPDRVASRILGMGDILSLVEKVQATIDEKKAREIEKKIRKDSFTLEDFRDQLRQIRKIGTVEQILGMMPGIGKIKDLKNLRPDEKELVKIEAIINSMTAKERQNYVIINGSRRKRIAKGSGTTVQDVNRLLKNYSQSLKMIKRLNKGGMLGLGGRGSIPFV